MNCTIEERQNLKDQYFKVNETSIQWVKVLNNGKIQEVDVT